MCVCVCVCVCVSVPRLCIKNHLREMKPETSPAAFQFLYMTLAIDTGDGHGLSNEAHCELLPKKSKVICCVIAIHFTV